MKPLTVRVPGKLYFEIAWEAKKQRVSKSEVIRERLATEPSRNESLWDRMHDLVIHEDKLPTDLSANKDYLRLRPTIESD